MNEFLVVSTKLFSEGQGRGISCPEIFCVSTHLFSVTEGKKFDFLSKNSQNGSISE
jgi:hypothetical protein